MISSDFFPRHAGISLAELAARLGLSLLRDSDSEKIVRGVAPVYRGADGDLCYILSRSTKAELETCQATAIICGEQMVKLIPDHVAVLIARNPHLSFAQAGSLLHPDAMRPHLNIASASQISDKASVDPTARLEDDVIIEPFAVVGAGAAIGSGTRIQSGAVVGPNVKIGRDCTIGAHVSLLCSLVGNNVIIHPGARIGQDGFGYAPGPRGFEKIVQIGRVIIQDWVEIGANATIDRGTMDDTVIGEGSKLDNAVMIGHNVKIGRHCGLVAGVGIAGSTKVGDGVLIGGMAAINGHIEIGNGAQVAAMSGVIGSVPAGMKVGGIPARPVKDFLRDAAEILLKSEMKAKDRKHG